jgi:hypothetical protein
MAMATARPSHPQHDSQRPCSRSFLRSECVALAGKLVKNLDSTDKELMMEWMSGQARSSDVPPRAGYYFGWRFASAMGKTRTLPQLADLPDAEVRAALIPWLEKLM